MKNKVLICTYTEFPNGSATATRIEEFINIFSQLGFVITIITMNNDISTLNTSSAGNIYYSFRSYRKGDKRGVLNYILYLFKLRRILKYNSFDLVVDMGSPVHCFYYLKYYCKANGRRMFYDILDWYSPEQFRLKWFSPTYQINNIIIKYGIDRNIEVIAISRYLEHYFKNKGIKVIYIPFIFEQRQMEQDRILTDDIRYIYAGIPGKKDLLYPFMNAMALLTPLELSKVTLDLYGVDTNYMLNYKRSHPDEYSYIESSVNVYGFVDRKKIVEGFHQADFSILLRNPEARFAKAGFPTKVAESLSLSTPVFCNITSDLGDFLIDEYNSIIVSSPTEEECTKKIRRILSLELVQRIQMRKNSFLTACEFLDTSKYIDIFKELLCK